MTDTQVARDDDEALLAALRAGGDAARDVLAELVRRHVDFVYSAARRQVGGDAHLAEDVTQAVFVLLDRKRPALAEGKLAGWLFNTTRFVARNALKMEMRRKKHERTAAAMRPEAADPTDWTDVGPVLDRAVAKLGGGERDVVLMHYFRNMTLAQVARKLGISEVAARQRSSRAIGKLRQILAKQGVACTTAGLADQLHRHAVTGAPDAVAAKAAATTGSGASLATAAGAAAVAIKLKIAAAVVAGTLAVGGGVVAVQRVAANRPAPRAAPAAAIAPADLTNFKTFHGVMTQRGFGESKVQELVVDPSKGLLAIRHVGDQAYVETSDDRGSHRFRQNGDLVVKTDRPAIDVAQARRLVGQIASWAGASPVRDPAADQTVDGERLRAFTVTHWRVMDNLPATVWVDDRGVVRHARTKGPESQGFLDLRIEIDRPLPAALPAELPRNARVVSEAALLEELYPLNKAVARADAGSYVIAVHAARRDTAGNVHLVLSSRPTDKARPFVGDSPPGNFYVRADGSAVKAAAITSRLDLAGASVRDVVIAPGASVRDGACEFDVGVLPWGPVTETLQQKGLPISGMAHLKVPATQPAGSPADALAATFDHAESLMGIVNGGVVTEMRGTVPMVQPPAQVGKEAFVRGAMKRLGLSK